MIGGYYMTTKQLEEYKLLQAEVKMLQDRIEQGKPVLACDTVRASSPFFPYVEHTVTIRGYDERLHNRYVRLCRRYERRVARHAKSLNEVEEWLDTVTDAKVRLLVQWYYIEGKTWRAAAQRVYGYPSESAARMRVERYLKNNL